jgi:hypothetical protein
MRHDALVLLGFVTLVPAVSAATPQQSPGSAARATNAAAVPMTVAARVARDESGDMRIVMGADVPPPLNGAIKIVIAFTTALGWANKTGAAEISASEGQPATGTFAMVVQPGIYHLQLIATDAAGHMARGEQEVDAELKPMAGVPASDVLLSWRGADRSVAHGWSLERLPADATMLTVAIELYPEDSTTPPPELEVAVIGADGREVLSRAMTTQPSGAKTVAFADLAMSALPAGRSEIRVQASARAGGPNNSKSVYVVKP